MAVRAAGPGGRAAAGLRAAALCLMDAIAAVLDLSGGGGPAARLAPPAAARVAAGAACRRRSKKRSHRYVYNLDFGRAGVGG